MIKIKGKKNRILSDAISQTFWTPYKFESFTTKNGNIITPIIPPNVETDMALPLFLPKYLAIVVSPA